MNDSNPALLGPDLTQGFPVERIPEGGMIAGQVDGAPVLLARRGALFHAVGGACSHYGAPLGDGLVTGDTVHCPLHHACFDLRTGRAVRGPALFPLPSYRVERRLDLVFVTGPQTPEGELHRPVARAAGQFPSRIVIAGAGAAGTAAALALRNAGYGGRLMLIGAEPEGPYDRPNLSKGYLSGEAPKEWLPLQPQSAYDSTGIRLLLGTPISRIDPKERTVWLEDGRAFPFDTLLLAPGAIPVHPPVPGIGRAHAYTLRSLADGEALIRAADSARRAVVIGAGFLGLEVAASLRARGIDVHVVAPDQRPLETVLGSALGTRLQRLHEERGVVLHLRHSVVEIGEETVRLDDGAILPADLVVVATGVRPSTTLAGRAGLVLAHGIQVDRYLETSRRGIFAAGDAVRWPDPRTGELIGCGHWSLAIRMGEAAAHNMLGVSTPFEAVPFFWSEHYDQRVNCTGITDRWDRIDVVAGLPAEQWEQRYWRGNTLVAVATINRDHASLEAELALERDLISSPARAALGRITLARESTR